MQFTKIFVSLIIIGAFAFNACKEKDKDPDPTKTNTEKLVGANWRLTAATFNPPLTVTIVPGFDTTFINLFDIPLIEACQKDNMIIFNVDSTMTIDNGALKCTVGEAQTAKDGNWRFINNETQIEITNSAYFSLISSTKVILENVTVSETEMKGQTDYTNLGSTTKIHFTFTKI